MTTQKNIDQKLSKLLDSREKMAKIDKSNALGSVEALADQIRQSWQETQKLEIKGIGNFTNIVVAGMGGSALGPDVIKHLFKNKLTVPFEVVNAYTLPAYVNKQTLVVLSSYSGTTEEVLAMTKEAQNKNAQIIVITAGGKLAELAEKNNWPSYIINPIHNPSNQPRMAIGNSIIGIIGLLNKLKILKIDNNEIDDAIHAVIAVGEHCTVKINAAQNPAKTLAFKLFDKKPILTAGEFLTGAVHVATNQFNENSKAYADYKIIPEINHHLMEGLKYPQSNSYTTIFVFFQSNLYCKRNQKRMILTAQVVEQNDIETITIDLKSETKLAQVFELISLMAYTNFYLSMLYQIDPSPIPFVNWLKKQLL